MSSNEEKTFRIPKRAFVSLPEVAAQKGVSRVAVLYDLRKKKLRGYRTPGRRDWLIPVESARAYLGLPSALA